jgi:hypothetical protein
MIERLAPGALQAQRTICFPPPEVSYHQIVKDLRAFRQPHGDGFRRRAERLPQTFEVTRAVGMSEKSGQKTYCLMSSRPV